MSDVDGNHLRLQTPSGPLRRELLIVFYVRITLCRYSLQTPVAAVSVAVAG